MCLTHREVDTRAQAHTKHRARTAMMMAIKALSMLQQKTGKVEKMREKSQIKDTRKTSRFFVKGIVRWDFVTHYPRRGRFREENAFYRIKNGHIFPKISATNNSILPCLKKHLDCRKTVSWQALGSSSSDITIIHLSHGPSITRSPS